MIKSIWEKGTKMENEGMIVGSACVAALRKKMADFDAAKDFAAAMATKADEALSEIVSDENAETSERRAALEVVSGEYSDLICSAFSSDSDAEEVALALAKADILTTLYEVVCDGAFDGAMPCQRRHIDIVGAAIASIPKGPDGLVDVIGDENDVEAMAERMAFLSNMPMDIVTAAETMKVCKKAEKIFDKMKAKLAADAIREKADGDEDGETEEDEVAVADMEGDEYADAIRAEKGSLVHLATAIEALENRRPCDSGSSRLAAAAVSEAAKGTLSKMTKRLASAKADADVFGKPEGKEKCAKVKADIALLASVFGQEAVDPQCACNKAAFDEAYGEAKELRESIKEDEDRRDRQMNSPALKKGPGDPIDETPATQRFHDFLKNRGN
jgi:hypothetical protein